jgi:hypothetical protein
MWRVVLVIALSILAITALTFLSAFQTSTEAFAIFLSAMRFFTRTFSCWNKCWNSLKKSWISIICYFFCLINLLAVFWLIFTADTDTVFIAKASSSKTLTIQFQAIYFCTLATLMIMMRMVVFSFGFNGIKMRNLRETVWWVCWGVVLVYKNVKEVFCIVGSCNHCFDVGRIVHFFWFHFGYFWVGIWLFNVLIIAHIKESFHLNRPDQIL